MAVAITKQSGILPVTKSRDPWDFDGRGLDLPVASVQSSFRSCSELTVAPEHWLRFSAGQSVAFSHWLGFLHGDLHPRHLIPDHETGRTMLIDWGNGQQIESREPELFAADFAAPKMSFSTQGFHALLSGYVNSARFLIDPERAEFTADILRELAIEISDYRSPVEKPNVGAALQCYGCRLTLDSGKVVVSGAFRKSDNATRLADIRVLASLAIIGIDSLPILDSIVFSDSPKPNSENSSTVFRCDDVLLPVDSLEQQLLRLVYDDEIRSQSSGAPDFHIAGIVVRRLSDCTRDIASGCVDTIVEVARVLSELCLDSGPEGAARYRAIAYTQYADGLLKTVLTDPLDDELRLADFIVRSRQSGWMRSFLKSDDIQSTVHELAYAHTRWGVLYQAFNASFVFANPRWSVMWRCLSLMKSCAAKLIEIQADQSLEYDEAFVSQIAKYLLSDLCDAIKLYESAMLQHGKLPQLAFGRLKADNVELFSAAVDACEVIDSKGLRTFEATAALASLKETGAESSSVCWI